MTELIMILLLTASLLPAFVTRGPGRRTAARLGRAIASIAEAVGQMNYAAQRQRELLIETPNAREDRVSQSS